MRPCHLSLSLSRVGACLVRSRDARACAAASSDAKSTASAAASAAAPLLRDIAAIMQASRSDRRTTPSALECGGSALFVGTERRSLSAQIPSALSAHFVEVSSRRTRGVVSWALRGAGARQSTEGRSFCRRARARCDVPLTSCESPCNSLLFDVSCASPRLVYVHARASCAGARRR